MPLELETDMPRDSSGNYTLPLGNPVVDGTVIETTWANPTMEDIAYQLNHVLTQDGLLGPTAPFKVLSGTLGAPGLAFGDAVTTGMFRASTYVGFGYAGALAFSYDNDSVDFTVAPIFATAPATGFTLANKNYVDAAISAAVGTAPVPGTVAVNATDITANKTIAATDFGTGVLRINPTPASTVINITVPTVASMFLPASPGRLRAMAFEVLSTGVPTFTGSAGVTINGVLAGAALPLGGAPKRYQFLVLTQTAVGSDVWSLS